MQTETITVHATYKDVRLPSERLRTLLSNRHVPAEIIDGCELALHELLTNLVDHAYDGDGSQLIKVTIVWDGSAVHIETQDTGKVARIDLSRVSMPEPTDLAEGGYGVAIIRSLMDDVVYRSESGRNTWKLVKVVREKEDPNVT